MVIYHISGCGVCDECQHGYMISCRSEFRAAYGWQRDGGHAPYLLAEENTCIRLPDSLSYIDGALCACGFGTAYEALRRMQVSGQDRLLITGLGPVGLAAAMLGRALGATTIIGTDLSESRLALASDLGLVDAALKADDGALGRDPEADRRPRLRGRASIARAPRRPGCWPSRARATGADAPTWARGARSASRCPST